MTRKNIIVSAILGAGFVASAAIAEPTDIERYADYEGVLELGVTQAPSKPSSIDIVQFADYDGSHGSYGSAQPQSADSEVAIWRHADYEDVLAAFDSVNEPLAAEFVLAMREEEHKEGRLPWPLSQQS